MVPAARSERALVDVKDLIRESLVNPADTSDLEQVATDFRIRISPEMHQAIGRAHIHKDPIALQFVPTSRELNTRSGELHDPIGDHAHSPTKGLTHRYPDRVILTATHTCEVYCRFCFRREDVGEDGPLSDAALEAAFDHIRDTPAIWEVILTGGDPLVLSVRRIAAILARLSEIEHVDVVRFHTRVPIVAPYRITKELIDALNVRPTVFIVLHTNHVNEITPDASSALARLAASGVPLLSQTVLLKGVNDSSAALAELFRCLVRNRVKPYYLHHCDLARGTSHFRTTIAEGQRIMAELRGNLSGICIPTYVLDIPGGFGKVPIGPGYLSEDEGSGRYFVKDYRGGKHRYEDLSL